ncbi:hypothetical protein ACS0TY_022919 [Phlomoides rotata]
MNYPPRRLTAPGASRKRKEVEPFHPSTLPKPLAPPTSVTRAVIGTNSVLTSPRGADQQPPLSSNRLLAGYMAHEFLTKGTLFGQIFDPSRAEAMPVSSAESKRSKQEKDAEPNRKSKPKPQSYADVANLLKSDGVHIPGVVNPTQLVRWIQM